MIYDIRPYQPSDKAFILATFLRGVYYGNQFFNMIPKNIFMDSYKKVGEALLVHPNVQIKVACLSDDPDVMIGYAMLSKDLETIHFCFIKSAWRQQGIMKAILPIIPKNSTHFTKLGLSLMNKYNITFNPFL